MRRAISSDTVSLSEGDATVDHPALARRCLGLVFLYHGLVPKLLLPDPLELSMIAAHPLPGDLQLFLYLGAGLEILLGLLLLSGRARWPLWVAGGLLVLPPREPCPIPTLDLP